MGKEQKSENSVHNFSNYLSELGQCFLGRSDNQNRIWKVRSLAFAAEGISILGFGSFVQNEAVTVIGAVVGGVGLATYRGIRRYEIRQLRHRSD